MSETFPSIATGWRWTETRAGDTLQSIAWRELGDASRWAELAALNDLIPPYLTADPAVAVAAGGRVLLHGQPIRVFAASDLADATIEPEELYGADVATDRMGFLEADAAGDLAVVAGVPNLSRALARRVVTERGELPFHPDYGSRIRGMIGGSGSPARAALAARFARDAIAADPRVSRIVSATGAARGDAIALAVEVEPISTGAAITIRAEV